MDSDIGLYLHIPFCRSKCPYCDFYSVAALPNHTEDHLLMESYTQALCIKITTWGERLPEKRLGSVYFGGGTPSLLGAKRIAALLNSVAAAFRFAERMEITLECNPSDAGGTGGFDFRGAALAGVNRISLGLQSAVDAERAALGQRGSVRDAERALERARQAGIGNLSLDVMLGIPNRLPERMQSRKSLLDSIAFCAAQDVPHVSAYLLKLESGTALHTKQASLAFPEEEAFCALYLSACEALEDTGLRQYEISNFARPGWESRHNLRYWNAEEYLGLGPAAHSFLDGKRFYYPRDLRGFLANGEPFPDGKGGSFEEYAMLRLRLTEGLTQSTVRARFGHGIPEPLLQRAAGFAAQGLVTLSPEAVALTRQGFLLSNRIIADLLG